MIYLSIINKNENYLSEFLQWKKHDFRLFKESGAYAKKYTAFEIDTGYIGITVIHPNTILPKKRSKITPLTKEETTVSFPKRESMWNTSSSLKIISVFPRN